MPYTLIISRRAQRELAGIADANYPRVRDAIDALRHTPRPRGCQRLRDRDGWRIRVGNYRVVYDIADEQRIVAVRQVGHRRDVYR